MKPAILITAYQQVNLTEENIKRIRNEYKTILKDCPIIIVFTSEEEVGFNKLQQKYKNIYYYHFFTAPGNIHSEYTNIKPVGANKYITYRIMFSMQHGLEIAKALNCDVVLHLHSDTYWQSEKEQILLGRMNYVLDGQFLVEMDNGPYHEDKKGFQPDGMIFNINECIKCGYGFNFISLLDNENYDDNCINPNKFYSPSYGPESTLAYTAIYSLTGKNYALKDELPCIVKQKISIRSKRTYHGEFDFGLVNLPGKQPQK